MKIRVVSKAPTYNLIGLEKVDIMVVNNSLRYATRNGLGSFVVDRILLVLEDVIK